MLSKYNWRTNNGKKSSRTQWQHAPYMKCTRKQSSEAPSNHYTENQQRQCLCVITCPKPSPSRTG